MRTPLMQASLSSDDVSRSFIFSSSFFALKESSQDARVPTNRLRLVPLRPLLAIVYVSFSAPPRLRWARAAQEIHPVAGLALRTLAMAGRGHSSGHGRQRRVVAVLWGGLEKMERKRK
jgi:hypothetical protein